MKYAILGDIHANLEALAAVLEDARAMGATDFACTGDLVGYNANPRECIEIVRDLQCPVVMGNHDEEASRSDPVSRMNPVARRAMEWTRSRLTPEDREWLGSLPHTAGCGDFLLVHATLDYPSGWQYLLNRFDAAGHFARQAEALCFYGHVKGAQKPAGGCAETRHPRPDAKKGRRIMASMSGTLTQSHSPNLRI